MKIEFDGIRSDDTWILIPTIVVARYYDGWEIGFGLLKWGFTIKIER